MSQDHAEAFCQQLKYNKLNMQFIEGHIEYLDKAGIADESMDMIISNCVVNLSPDKRRVLQEAYRVLAKGGEFYFSDVYCDRRLPQHVKDNQVGPECAVLEIHLVPSIIHTWLSSAFTVFQIHCAIKSGTASFGLCSSFVLVQKMWGFVPIALSCRQVSAISSVLCRSCGESAFQALYTMKTSSS